MRLRTMMVTVAVVLFAQIASAAVWVVDESGGPGTDYTEITAAVAAAADGDTILVRQGTYLPFTVMSKALEIVAEAGDVVQVAGGIAIRSLTTTQTVVLRGIDTTPPLGNGTREEGLLVLQCAGPVFVEDGTFHGGWEEIPAGPSDPAEGTAFSGARIEGSPRVVLTRSSFVGRHGWLLYFVPGIALYGIDGGDGVRAVGSELTFYDCALSGGDGGSDWDSEGESGGHGGHGLRADGGFAFLSGTTLTAGDGGDGGDSEGFTDPYAGDGGDGGDGLHVRGGPTVRLLDVALTPGQGGAGGYDFSGLGWDGAPGTDGQPVDADTGTDIVRYPPPARTCEVTSPVREGQAYTVTVGGEPLDAVLLYAAPTIAPFFRPAFHGTSVPGAPYRSPVTVAVIPRSGELELTFAAPAIPVDVESFVFQAVVVEPSGDAVLSSPSRLAVFDASY